MTAPLRNPTFLKGILFGGLFGILVGSLVAFQVGSHRDDMQQSLVSLIRRKEGINYKMLRV